MAILHKLLKRTAAREALIACRAKKKPQNKNQPPEIAVKMVQRRSRAQKGDGISRYPFLGIVNAFVYVSVNFNIFT